jgi:hypothetical protein
MSESPHRGRTSQPRYPRPATDDEPVQAWVSLPRRIYLDACTLQAMYDFGGVIFDAVPFEPFGRVEGEELDALRMIFLVNERAGFEFVVTPTSLREVVDRGRRGYTQWVHDVGDTWLVQSHGYNVPQWGRKFEHRRFGMISAKDRILLQDAIDLGCDAFMTMEKRLPKNAGFIEKWTGLRVMRPSTYWGLLDRWANLYC